jgi:hypothetical protein
LRAFKFLLGAFFARCPAAARNMKAAHILLRPVPRPNGKDLMTISSIAAQTSLSALYAASQTSAASQAGAMAIPGDDDADELAAAGSGMTGSTTASLDSQTLQALLGLTQESDPAQGAQGQPGASGVHHHHHHHGGGQAQQPPTASTSATATTSTASATADPSIAESDMADESQDSLASALTALG